MKLADNVADILRRATIDGLRLVLPAQLDRKDYEAVNKALTAAGWKWERKHKAHMALDRDAVDALAAILRDGRYMDPAKELEYFPTPEWLAYDMCQRIGLDSQDVALEPSAGEGHIADIMREAALSVRCVEKHRPFADKLRAKGHDVDNADFLTWPERPIYSAIVMNPPFSRNQDVAHVYRAFRFLAPAGRLVSVIGAHSTFAMDNASIQFRAFLEHNRARVEALPDGAFQESGTSVRAFLVEMERAA